VDRELGDDLVDDLLARRKGGVHRPLDKVMGVFKK
jgi:hypothetical protein